MDPALTGWANFWRTYGAELEGLRGGRREAQEHGPFEAQGRQDWLYNGREEPKTQVRDRTWGTRQKADPSTARPDAPEFGAEEDVEPLRSLLRRAGGMTKLGCSVR